jgi:flagellar hook protein FlgE
MSFQYGLSGLNASSRNLDVIGNNIANSSTIGMKASRTEFADLVASSMSAGNAGNTAATGGSGIGVSIATVSQNFSQGNINITGNDLDVAINGGGFFKLTMPDNSTAYTRDGEFKLDKLGNIVTNTGANVMGYPTDTKGVPTSTTPQALQLPTNAPIGANQTTSITSEFNLDARAVVAASATPPTPRATYGTSFTAYDSQGAPVPVNLYFERAASTGVAPNVTDNWNVYDVSTGGAAPDALVPPTQGTAGTPGFRFQMQFNSGGKLVSPATAPTLTIATPSAVTPSISATLDISKVTQYGSAFAVSNLTQDGYAAGELVGMKVGNDGKITARYSNGQSQINGQIVLADFRNVQGLTATGSGNWIETAASGQPIQGSPGVGKFGALTPGALEESNIDLTAELVNMMTAQRAYQANAQTIKTQDQLMTTLVNLR